MNRFIFLSLIFSIAFCQTNTDDVCPGTEVTDRTHMQLNFSDGDKCILIGAVQNLGKFKTAINAGDIISGGVVDSTFELSFEITDPSDCGSGSEPCFDTEFYSIVLENKNSQDAAQAGGSVLSSKVVFDATKISDTANWCEAANGEGVIQCTITVSYGFKGITGPFYQFPVTIDITPSDEVKSVVDDQITVIMKDQAFVSGISGSCLFDRDSTLTRHENGDFDETPLTNPQKGGNIFLQLALDHPTDQAIGPFSTTGYSVFLESTGGSEIDITDRSSNVETVNIGVGGSDNHVLRLQVQMNFVGTYNIRVEAQQPTPSPRRVLEGKREKKLKSKNVAKSFLSVTVLPNN